MAEGQSENLCAPGSIFCALFSRITIALYIRLIYKVLCGTTTPTIESGNQGAW